MSTALLTGNPALEPGGGNVVYIPSICNTTSKPTSTVTYNIPSQYTPCKMGVFLCTNLGNMSEGISYIPPSSIICAVGQDGHFTIQDGETDRYLVMVDITFDSNKITFKVSEYRFGSGVQVNIDAILAS